MHLGILELLRIWIKLRLTLRLGGREEGGCLSPFYSSIINFGHSCLKKGVVSNLLGELPMVFLVSSWFDTKLGLNMCPPLDPPKHFRSNSCIYVGLESHLLKLSLQALIELNRIKKNDIFEEE